MAILLCVSRKVDRRVRRRRNAARGAHIRTRNACESGARWLGEADAGAERKGLPSFDPILISASRSVRGYRRAIAIDPDTHPPLNPVLPVKPALLGWTRSPFSGPGADAPRRTACIPARTSRSSSDNTSLLTDVRSVSRCTYDAIRASQDLPHVSGWGKLSKRPLLTINTSRASSYVIFTRLKR